MKDKNKIITTIMNYTLLVLALGAIIQDIKNAQIIKKIDNITSRLEQLEESKKKNVSAMCEIVETLGGSNDRVYKK